MVIPFALTLSVASEPHRESRVAKTETNFKLRFFLYFYKTVTTYQSLHYYFGNSLMIIFDPP